MGEHEAEHTCMLMGRDCTTGRCGQPGRWGGVTEEWECLFVCLSVPSPWLTAWHWLLTNASSKLGICSHVQYVGVRILSRSLYFLFFLRPHLSFPPSPALFLNLPPPLRYLQYTSLFLRSPFIFMFHLFSLFLASLSTSSSFLRQIGAWLNINQSSCRVCLCVCVCVCEQGRGGCVGNGRAFLSR